MATTINSYSVSLAMDAGNYIRSSKLSRKETAGLTRDINAARSPAEKYERNINRLDKALKAGAITQGSYNRLVDSAKSKLDKASASTKALTSSTKVQSSAMAGARDKLATMAKGFASLAAAQQLVSRTRQEFQNVDFLAKSSRGLGEDINAVQRYQFALAEIAGVAGPQAIDTLKKLQKSIGETAIGIGRGKIAFKELNIDIEKLKQLSPVQQFEAIRNEMSKVENRTERAALATKIFGEQGQMLLPVLDATAKAYGISADQVDRLGLSLTDEKVANIEATNDAIGRLDAAIQGLIRTGAGLETFSQHIDRLAGALGPISDLGMFTELGSNPITTLIDAAQGKVDPAKFEAFKRLANQVGLFGDTKARAGTKNPFDVTMGGKAGRSSLPLSDTSTGGISGIALSADFSSLGDRISGGLGQLGGVFESVGGFMAQANRNAIDGMVEAQKESPAIKSLEVGTQEAYKFLTDGVNKQLEEDAKNAARQERIAANGEKLLKGINDAVKAIKSNGFRRIG